MLLSIPDLDQFLGTQPPVRTLRFANPNPLTHLNNASPILATEYGLASLQDPQFELYNGLSEDCLIINVICPHNAMEPLPVMVFIYRGGNEDGQSLHYNGTALVQHPIAIGHPIVYVTMNYRLGGFDFLVSPK